MMAPVDRHPVWFHFINCQGDIRDNNCWFLDNTLQFDTRFMLKREGSLKQHLTDLDFVQERRITVDDAMCMVDGHLIFLGTMPDLL